MPITVKRLKELLVRVPDDATVMAYDGIGDDATRYVCGITISSADEKRSWWIAASSYHSEIETETEGF